MVVVFLAAAVVVTAAAAAVVVVVFLVAVVVVVLGEGVARVVQGKVVAELEGANVVKRSVYCMVLMISGSTCTVTVMVFWSKDCIWKTIQVRDHVFQNCALTSWIISRRSVEEDDAVTCVFVSVCVCVFVCV